MNCVRCKGENPPGAARCVHCGAELGAAPSVPQEAPAPPQAPRDARQMPATVPASPFQPQAPDALAPVRTATQVPTGRPGALERMIPAKNPLALTAYYLGVFSIIPCVGLPLGVAALVLGILGLGRAKRQPQARGKVHALIGVIVGGLFAAIWLAAATIWIAAMLSLTW